MESTLDVFDLELRVEDGEASVDVIGPAASGDCTDTCHTLPNC